MKVEAEVERIENDLWSQVKVTIGTFSFTVMGAIADDILVASGVEQPIIDGESIEVTIVKTPLELPKGTHGGGERGVHEA